MAGTDLLINNDGDYNFTGGFFETTETAQPAIRHQTLDRLGEWIGDPAAGRIIYGLAGRNDSQREAERRKNSLENAYRLLVEAGLISDVVIQIDRDQVGRFAIRVSSRDTQTGGLIEFDTLSEFGV